MKKRIWILRHGEAERESSRDAERTLTDRGIRDARAVGEWLATVVTPDLTVFASPYTRAQQTAKNAVRALPNNSIATATWLTPDIDPAAVIAAIEKLDFSELLLVSHQPLVSALIGMFIAADYRAGAPMATASLAELEMDTVGAGCASLSSLRHAPDYHHKATY
jgi:phosphohistidine phosphatase